MTPDDLDTVIDVQLFNHRWTILRNYHSDDVPYGERGRTHGMFALREFTRVNTESAWEGPSTDEDYSVIDDALVRLEFMFSEAMSSLTERITVYRLRQ
ncbi:MAG: hypothetical protein ACE5H4_13655 [Candidatus Thorarchaeota archaeon]